MVSIIAKQDAEISTLKRALAGTVARSMKHNIVVTGMVEEKNENPKWAALEFLKKNLKLVDNVIIQKAYHLGSGSDRPLVLELANIEDKKKIYHCW